jgi:hypothetical protein
MWNHVIEKESLKFKDLELSESKKSNHFFGTCSWARWHSFQRHDGRGEVDHGSKTPSRLVESCRDPAPLLEIAKQVFDDVTPTNYGEIAWDAGLEIRLERPVRVIGRANPARRKVKPAHPAGSKNACREQAQLPAP